MPPTDKKNHFYGRRKGRTLPEKKQMLVKTLLKEISVVKTSSRNSTPMPSRINVSTLLPAKKEFWLEIGFGAGEHLIYQAKAHPEIGFIGVEAFLNGVARILTEIDQFGLKNIRLYHGLIQDLLPCFPDDLFSYIFILFPDPWPKRRHAKRRLVSADLASELARISAHGSYLRLASDIPHTRKSARANILNHAEFTHVNTLTRTEQFSLVDYPQTRYEKKALLEGRKPVYFEFLCQKG